MNNEPIKCRIAVAPELGAITANEIRYLPTGSHAITPVHGGIGKPIKIKITQEAAQAIEEQRQALVAKGKRPYFDFDHKDGPASFWPDRFVWRSGEGVIAIGDWSRKGREAVEGKDYRCFSPVFHVDNKRAEEALVICHDRAMPNMGGLVNDPAFNNLAVWSKNAGAIAGEETKNNEEIEMTTEELAALRAKQQELENEVSALKAVNDDQDDKALLSAKEAEVRAIHAEIEVSELRAENQRQADIIESRNKSNAEAAVKAAIQRGAILPKAHETQRRLIRQATLDPSQISVINDMQGQGKFLSTSVVSNYGRVTVTEDDPGIIYGALARVHSQALQSANANERRDCAREFAKIFSRELSIKSSNAERTLAFPVYELSDVIKAGDVTDANLGTLSGTLVVQRTLELLKFNFPDVTSFTTDFSDQTAAFNQTIMTRTIDIPAAVDYNTSTGWATSTHVTHDVPVTINKHKGVTITFNEQTLASTVRRLFDESAEAAAYSLGKTLVDELYSKITDANFTHNRVVATASVTRSSVIDIAVDLDLLGVPMGANNRTLLLYPTVFGQLQKDSAIVSLAAYQRSALITDNPLSNGTDYMINVSGFRVISAPNLPTNNANLTGFAGSKSALCIATRMPNDYTTWGTGVAHGHIQMITEPDIGLSVMLTQYVDHTLATGNQRFSFMFGCAAGQGNAGELLKAAAGSGSSRTS